MKKISNICDPAIVELFLQQGLSQTENAKFEDHLEHCDQCRTQLETAAANVEDWSEIRNSLNSEGCDFGDETGAYVQPLMNRESILQWLAPTDDHRMMGRIGAYEVVGIVGTSSMAVVLKAFEPALDRYVAIKLLAPWLHTNGAARKRFSREAQAAAAVVHDNVIEIHCVSESNELPYLVMPFVKGPSLQRRLNDQGPLEVAEVLRIGMQAARGLAAAHEQGLVHRDVKPSNIMLADGVERVKLTDFGLARAADDASLTRSGIIAGTPQYMSPEQVRGQNVEQHSDLFSLGSVLYAMCTGRAPFRAETSYGVMRQVTDRQPRPVREINPRIPDWLCGVISKLMAKQPEHRFESAAETAEILQQCLAHVQQPTTTPLPDSVAGNTSINSRVLALAAIALVAVAIGALVYFLSGIATDVNKELPSSANSVVKKSMLENEMPERITEFKNILKGNDAKVAISPNGTQLVMASGHPTMTMLGGGKVNLKGWKPTLDVIDTKTGKKTTSLQIVDDEGSQATADTNPVNYIQANAIKYSADGSLIAVGNNIGQVRIFDAKSGKLIRELDDKAGRLADEKTPDSWKNVTRAMGGVKSLAFSPDGKQLATIGESFADFAEKFDRIERMGFWATAPGRLKLWDVDTGELQYDLNGHNDSAVDVAFSPNGKLLASAGRWSNELERFGNGVIVWDARSGARRNYIRSTADGGVHSIAFTADSNRLVFGAMRFGDGDRSGSVSMADVSNGHVRWLVTVPGWAKPLQVLPTGKHVAVLCGENLIRFLNIQDGSHAGEISKDSDLPDRAWKDFAVAANGQIGVAAVNKQNIGFEVWDAGDFEGIKDAEKEPSNQQALANPELSDTPAMEAESVERKAKSKKPDLRSHFNTSAPVQMLACSQDGQTIAVVNPDADGGPVVELYSYDGKLLHSIKPFNAHDIKNLAGAAPLVVEAIALHGEKMLLAVGSNFGQVKLFDVASGELVQILVGNSCARGNVHSMKFSPDGTMLVTGGQSIEEFAKKLADENNIQSETPKVESGQTETGQLMIWDIDSGEVKHNLKGHVSVADVAFSPDGKILVTAGSIIYSGYPESGPQSGVILWSVETGKQIRTNILDKNWAGSYSIAVSPDQTRIAVGVYPDKEQERSSIITLSLANMNASGVVWKRKVPGLNKSVAFMPNSNDIMALFGDRTVKYIGGSGSTLMHLTMVDKSKNGRKTVFATAKEGDMQLFGGVDENGKGTVDILDLKRE